MKRMIVLLIAIAFTLMGCWDSKETETLGIVTLMGVGLGDNDDIKVIIQEKPHEKQTAGIGGAVSKTPFFVYTESGKTIFEALEKMATNEHHKLYFAHTNVILFDEELVSSKGIKSVLDFYERNPEIRLNTWLLISPKGQLDKVLSTDVGLNIDTGTILGETINNEKANSYINVGNISDTVELLNKSGSELFAAGISISPKSSGNSNGSANKKFSIRDTAVFKGEKMLGWLNTEEHRGLSWINGNFKGGVMVIPFENKALSLQIANMKSKIKPEISNGEMQININIEVASYIIESQNNFDFFDLETIKKVEKTQNEEIKKDITAVLNRSRELQSDFLGFGNYFDQRYPVLWKEIKNDWYSYYPDIEVNIYVNSTIKNTGKVYNSLSR